MADSARHYLDNAATTWPKPESVYEAVALAMRELGAPAGRGSYREGAEVGQKIEQLRHGLLRLVGASSQSYRTLFTYSGTDSLNQLLLGGLRPGDHVIASDAEHNSVLRPLRHLAETREVQVTYVPVDAEGMVEQEAYLQALKRPTKLVVFTHASNVTGVVQPIELLGAAARERGAWFFVDAAQTLGHFPLSLRDCPADAIAAPGHKGLLGPLGTGVMILRAELADQILPLRWGGTGSRSESDEQPRELPDRYEAGNLNVPGLWGLAAGCDYVSAQGVEQLAAAQQALLRHLLDHLSQIPRVSLDIPSSSAPRIGVVSFHIEGLDPQEVAAALESMARVQVRAGFHCAPRMHRALGNLARGGSVRASVGPFTTLDDVAILLAAVEALAESVG